MLGAIAVAAQNLTAATGAAIAMWKDAEMVCRARCGETAPPLGARLSPEWGISGSCLHTGQPQMCVDAENDVRVDTEVCRQLGVRSIAVMPIQGWRGVNGILEVFATSPQAFTEEHLGILRRLAAMADKARAARPESAFAASQSYELRDRELRAASSGTGDLARFFLGSRKRPLLIVLGLLAAGLLALAIWLGWHTPDENVGVQASLLTPNIEERHVSDKGPVWDLKASKDAGRMEDPVKLASRVDVISEAANAPLIAKPSAAIGIRREPLIPFQEPHNFPKVETSVEVEPPPLLTAAANSSPLNGVLDAPASTPRLASPPKISRGVMPGYLLRRVPPVYPRQALEKRLEGKVVIEGEIAEDGSIENLKSVEGDATLASAAMDAVRRWRYKPYELDGKPVRIETTVVMNFKLP